MRTFDQDKVEGLLADARKAMDAGNVRLAAARQVRGDALAALAAIEQEAGEVNQRVQLFEAGKLELSDNEALALFDRQRLVRGKLAGASGRAKAALEELESLGREQSSIVNTSRTQLAQAVRNELARVEQEWFARINEVIR